jgi:hypothetical protein
VARLQLSIFNRVSVATVGFATSLVTYTAPPEAALHTLIAVSVTTRRAPVTPFLPPST